MAGAAIFNQDLRMQVSRSQTGPVALIALGAIAIVAGTLGLVLGWGSAPGPSPAASPAPRPTEATSSTNPSEQPAVFLASFVQALRGGDATFLFDRLDPAVLARYGEQQCRTSIPHLFDPTAALKLRSTTGPTAFDYASDGKSVAVADVDVLAVDGVLGGQPVTRDYHVAQVDGLFRIFFDCGDPLPGAP